MLDDVLVGCLYLWMCYKNVMEFGVYLMNYMIKVGDIVLDMKEGRNVGMWIVGVIFGSSEFGLMEEEVESMDLVEFCEKIEIVCNWFVENGVYFMIEMM